jgi:hypothetical protein
MSRISIRIDRAIQVNQPIAHPKQNEDDWATFGFEGQFSYVRIKY